ncbi:uncharacterized protein LOC143185110 [Calliopsis andreniformis]|uniref:uncharacterized protein LOC143185110 n=1 Tax=Calliopsis andreniformis TaxID=337506 RepID=UPI003FCEA110
MQKIRGIRREPEEHQRPTGTRAENKESSDFHRIIVSLQSFEALPTWWPCLRAPLRDLSERISAGTDRRRGKAQGPSTFHRGVGLECPSATWRTSRAFVQKAEAHREA